ncbi:hypothetical protein P8627_04440 [Jannaschia sp. GRR-S6-38]|uniref:Uncharacterized protein n=1 Tax=Jannaschia ovalis TaxID=3038773 RepID=A0ABY8LHA3_9RHOB|nr:hypothetical protein [Jannaschia sp. GRR-S6-38]WGH79520.1 hypothetical protein P8627_04440 [Jannaschia sp. GRR-S6-38]
MVQRAAAVTPDIAENSTNFDQRSRVISSVGGAATPASVRAARRASIRAEGRLSRSAKTNRSKRPVWRITPGSAIVVETCAMPLAILPGGRIPANRSAASTPLRKGTTTVSGPSIGRQARAASGRSSPLTPKMTTSTGPTAAGSSVAMAGRIDSRPSGPSRMRPSCRMASRCRPRAMAAISCPARPSLTAR